MASRGGLSSWPYSPSSNDVRWRSANLSTPLTISFPLGNWPHHHVVMTHDPGLPVWKNDATCMTTCGRVALPLAVFEPTSSMILALAKSPYSISEEVEFSA